MRILNYKFTPGLWPTLFFVLFLPFFISMGFWQLDRSDQKDRLQTEYLAQKNKPAVNLQTLLQGNQRELQDWSKVIVEGAFVDDITVLLDNKIVNRKAGYYIFRPVKLYDSDIIILVNLGWQAAELTRDTVPNLINLSKQVRLQGHIKQPQFSGIKLSETDIEQLSNQIIRVQNIDYEQLNNYFGFNLENFIVRVTRDNKLGYYTNWQDPGFGKEKHLGYAFQWFAFAAVLVFLFIYLNLRSEKDDTNKY